MHNSELAENLLHSRRVGNNAKDSQSKSNESENTVWWRAGKVVASAAIQAARHWFLFTPNGQQVDWLFLYTIWESKWCTVCYYWPPSLQLLCDMPIPYFHLTMLPVLSSNPKMLYERCCQVQYLYRICTYMHLQLVSRACWRTNMDYHERSMKLRGKG